MKAIDNIIDSEVLVIGSGLAGSLAAIKCHELGFKVVVANKGPVVGGGATSVIGGKTMNVCFPDDDKDLWEKRFLEIGGYDIDREWLKIYLEDTYPYAIELDALGQKYREAIFPRHPGDKSQGFWRLGPWEGIEEVRNVVFYGSAAEAAFRKKVLAERISFFPRTEVTGLITDGQRVIGAVGFNYRSGDTYLFKARAVILSCGGVRFEDAISSTVGEGVAIAYEAGARIRSLGKERARFKPRFSAHIGALGDGFYSNGTTYPFDGKLVNAMGEVFMEKVPPGTNLEDAIQKEISHGGGPIFEEWTQIPPELHEVIKTLKKPYWKLTLSKFGLDAFKSRVPFPEPQEQVALPGRTSHFGVEIDHHCSSNIQGLFALGDNASNFIRKSPFRGEALAWALLTGSRVSKFVKDYLTSYSGSAMNEKEVMAQANNHIGSLAVALTRSSGPSPDEVASKLLCCLSPFDEIIADKNKIEEAIAKVNSLQKECLPEVKARDYHELKKAFEVKSLLLNVEIILRSQLIREENSAAWRDLPKYTMLEKHDGSMTVYGRDVTVSLNAALK